MAMDLIQATAVPCEQIFSSSAETDTKWRNHISPPLMEALQMRKFLFKKECLEFMHDWILQEKQLLEDDPDEDLLLALINKDTQTGQNNLDKVIWAINQAEG